MRPVSENTVFVNAGTGASERSVQSRLRDSVSVKDFGAKGDGIADDTAAFTAAIAFAAGRIILIPAGTYLVGTLTGTVARFQGDGELSIIKATGTYGVRQGIVYFDAFWARDLTIDADNISDLCVKNYGDCDIERVKLKNAKGSASGLGALLRHQSPATRLRVVSCNMSDVTGVENGVEGDESGADCGIYLNSGNFWIEGTTFDRIGGYEDGDCIRVQVTSDPVDLWVSCGRGSRIVGCIFTEIKKRAIKVQGSDVEIRGNKITSTVTTDNTCPYAGIDVFGSRNLIENNDISLERASYGVINSTGTGNIWSDNRVTLAPTSQHGVTRTNAPRAMYDQAGVKTKFHRNVIKTTENYCISFGASSANGDVFGNRFIIGVAFGVYLLGSGHRVHGNEFWAADSGVPFNEAVFLDGATNCRIEFNTFNFCTKGIRLNSTATGNVIGPNQFISISFRSVDLSTLSSIVSNVFKWESSYRLSTSTNTAGPNEGIIECDASGGAFTQNLPTAIWFPGREVLVKKTDSSTNVVTIDPFSTQTIDGAATYPLSAQNKYVRLVSNNANWIVLGGN